MPPTKSGLTILVVDDSRQDLVLMSSMLSKLGYKVVPCSSGESALEMFRQLRPDMVLMDVIMPGMSGFDAVREIRAILGDEWIPIIFITGLEQEDNIVQGIEAGGDDFIIKPIHYKLLQTKIVALDDHLQLFRRIKEQSKLLSDYQQKNEEEQFTAHKFMSRLLALDKINDPLVQFHLEPAEVFSGDLIAAARSPAGQLYVMLADSTGHGLTAALAVMPVMQTFHAMVAKGYALNTLAAELNRKVQEYMPTNRFVAAVLVAIDEINARVSVWNGGCPPSVLLNPDGLVVYQFDSKHLPLGILNPNVFDDSVTHYHYGNNECQILLCSDGAVDTADPHSMEIGIKQMLQALRTDKIEERLPAIVSMLEEKLAGKQAHDDIALILVRCPAEHGEEFTLADKTDMLRQDTLLACNDNSQEMQEQQVEWQFSLTLTAPQLRQADIVPLLLHIVNQIELDTPSLSGKLFLILSELFNNALDHGLLQLDSVLKNDPHGLDVYFTERAVRLKALDKGEIKIDLLKVSSPQCAGLKIIVGDSGKGFDYQALQLAALEENMRRHGRGIALVESLCSDLLYTDGGRVSQALVLLDKVEL